ncbi:MAG TPA: SRPBCC domain-containing protein [Chitinophagaceae bacterium]|nr:SRPBCC domain-containing protein [Chitinophagaceae bacterium]
MSKKDLEIKVGLIIRKPEHEVFEAIVDPEKMKNYFIATSTGRMEEGETLTWKFPEMELQFPVRIKKIIKDKFISYNWDDFDKTETLVEITLTPKENKTTFVTVVEKSKPNNEEGIRWLKSNTEGWANFLCCMKAWLEFGVHLRKGAFDLSQMPEAVNK